MSSIKAKQRVAAHLRAKRSRQEAEKPSDDSNNYGFNRVDKSMRRPSSSSVGPMAMNRNSSLDRKSCSLSGTARSVAYDTTLGKVNLGADSTLQGNLGSIPRKRPSSYKAGRERKAKTSGKSENVVNLKLNRVRRGTVEDMQRGLIEWDIMAELQAEVTNCRQAYEMDHEGDFRNITIPSRFQSFEDYLAVWSPLAIRELRAHFMNKCLTEPPDIAIPVRAIVSRQSNAASSSLVTLDIDIVGQSGAGNILAGNEILIMTKHGKALTILQELEQKFYSQQGAGAEVPPGRQKKKKKNPDPCLSGMLGICTTWSKGHEGIRVVVHKERFSSMKLDVVSNLFWHPLGPQVQFVREWLALNNLDSIPLATEILHGGNPTITECELQHVKIEAGWSPFPKVKQDNAGDESDSMLLNISSVGDGGPQIRANIGKFHIGSNFMSWLERKLNPSQKFAVEWAATHEGFTLIKGPPGTGKTTTLTALLNAIHVREYNRYYEGILNLVALPPGSNLDVALRQIRDEKKPHILVTAPSNIAVDNIVNRILDDGFLDGTGKIYKPDILRVGRSFGTRVACVSLEERVNSVMRISESEHRDRKKELLSKMDSLRTEISRYMTILQLMLYADRTTGPLPRDDWETRVDLSSNRPYFVNHKMKTTQFDPPELAEDGEVVVVQTNEGAAGEGPAFWRIFDMPEYIGAADGLINALEEYHYLEYEKKTIDFALQHSNSKNVSGHIFRDCLEGVFLGSAHIVFSTLNSSGRECMTNCTQFKVVIVDEAAQSVELSTLIPLRLGGRQCVLVGDPQQLSATVFSQNGAATQFDRSLFERLEDCGHRVHLLDTQYRMHPAISYFPRMQFYDNKLLDGPNVLQQSYSMPYHTYVAFQPFVFMNLSTGSSVSTDKSLSNPVEAQLAVNVYLTLSFLTRSDISGNIGVITPYNSQRIELSHQFKDVLGSKCRDMVEISTVDGFQGREKNAIIVSLVRAHGKGVGFLKDLRRMNVALTRARHYLCVIGHEVTLAANTEWKKVIDRAKKTGAFIDIQDPTGDLLQLQVKKK